jgi:hypothetical protein
LANQDASKTSCAGDIGNRQGGANLHSTSERCLGDGGYCIARIKRSCSNRRDADEEARNNKAEC